MSRPLRIQYPGAWYHVMNRGRRGEKIFVNDKDYLTFIGLLKQIVELWRIRVSAYCLMPNHYHLLVQTPEGNLSRCMRHLNGIYTQRFNHFHGYDGQLFRGRYKSILVDADNYLLQLVRYIHKNPLKAGLSKGLVYQWSSHAGYVSNASKWDWLHKDFILGLFSGERNKQKEYLRFMSGDDTEEIRQFFSMKKLPSILGNTRFLDWVKDHFFEEKQNDEVPQSKILAPSVETILAVVCKTYEIETDALFSSRRGVVNEPRNMSVYLLRNLCGDDLKKIGDKFRIKTYSAVSSILGKMETRLAKDKALKKRLAELKRQIRKSQRQT